MAIKRQIVVLVHGYGEHVFRPQYIQLTKFLHSVGWEVRRHIIRKHWNGTDTHTSHSFYFDNFTTLLEDLNSEIRSIKEEVGEDNTSVVLIGKSLGGLLTVRCLEELSDDLKTIVVGGVTLSPCLQIGGKYDSPAKRALAYFIVDYLGWNWFYSPLDQLKVCDVTKKGSEYSEDPHILSRGVWAGVAVATRNETFIAHQRKDRLDRDLLILHGSEDKVCECSASRDFVKETAPFSQIETFSGTAHDLLDENKQVLDRIYWRIEAFLSGFTANKGATRNTDNSTDQQLNKVPAQNTENSSNQQSHKVAAQNTDNCRKRNVDQVTYSNHVINSNHLTYFSNVLYKQKFNIQATVLLISIVWLISLVWFFQGFNL